MPRHCRSLRSLAAPLVASLAALIASACGPDSEGIVTGRCAETAGLCCPLNEEKSTVVYEVTTNSTVAADSKIEYGLFPEYPPKNILAIPKRGLNFDAKKDEVSFPKTIIDTKIKPDKYVAYICYDHNGDNTIDECDDPEDRWAIFPAVEQFTVPDFSILNVTFDLDTKTTALVSSQPATDFGCVPMPPE